MRPLLPHRTLRAQLTVLYAAVFCASAAALAATAVVFKPNFLVHTSCEAYDFPAGRPTPCDTPRSPSFLATVGHDARQNTAGVAMAGLLVLLALGIGWLIAGRVLRPLLTVIAAARDISARNLDRRLALDGPGEEFRQLGATLDGLFERLEAAFQAQRHFVANASHELRTPLTAERTVLQVALADPGATAHTLRSACEKALEWSGRQERLIDALLTLAGSERGIERWEPFDLAAAARKAILDHQDEAARRGIRIDAALTAAPATGDPALADSLLANLVGNAVRHNIDGGRVEIATAMTGGRAVLTIGNTGPLVPADEVDRLFQPFQRLGAPRIRHTSGHGLGLAIVRAITTAHNAALTAAPGPEGGLHITLTFP